jgi:hypothetical protein
VGIVPENDVTTLYAIAPNFFDAFSLNASLKVYL